MELRDEGLDRPRAAEVAVQELGATPTIDVARELHTYRDVRSTAPSAGRLDSSTTRTLVLVVTPSSAAVFTNELERSDGPKYARAPTTFSCSTTSTSIISTIGSFCPTTTSSQR